MDVYQDGKGNGKIYVYKQTATTNIRVMKQQKALAWKNVRNLNLNPSFIVHTDQDIIFGGDLNVFVDYVKNRFKSDTPLLALFKDQDKLRVSCTPALWSCSPAKGQTHALPHGEKRC